MPWESLAGAFFSDVYFVLRAQSDPISYGGIALFTIPLPHDRLVMLLRVTEPGTPGHTWLIWETVKNFFFTQRIANVKVGVVLPDNKGWDRKWLSLWRCGTLVLFILRKTYLLRHTRARRSRGYRIARGFAAVPPRALHVTPSVNKFSAFRCGAN